MTQARVEFIDGPAHGAAMDRPRASTVRVPVPMATGIGQAIYTLRSCRNAAGKLVEVLALAGREIDRKWLVARGLTN